MVETESLMVMVILGSRLASRLDVEGDAQRPQVLVLYGGMRKFLRVSVLVYNGMLVAACTQV